MKDSQYRTKDLKTLQIITTSNLGGAEIAAIGIANGLAELGVQSHLCVEKMEGGLNDLIHPAVKYLYIKRNWKIDLFASYRLYHYIVKNKIEIIHAHAFSYLVSVFIKLLQKKTILVWHDQYGSIDHKKKRKKEWLVKFSSRYFNAVFSCNVKLNNWANQILKVKRNYIIPNFPISRKRTEKTTFLKGDPRYRIIHLAGLRPQKDHFTSIKSFRIVLEAIPEASLHMVGHDNEDQYSNQIKDYISHHKLKDKIFVYGGCKDIDHILEQSSIAVLTSKSEGLPLVLFEYGSKSLAVVSTDVGDIKKVIGDNEYGILLKPGDEIGIAHAIIDLLNNVETRHKLGLKLKSKVALSFNQNAICKRIINIYNELKTLQNAK